MSTHGLSKHASGINLKALVLGVTKIYLYILFILKRHILEFSVWNNNTNLNIYANKITFVNVYTNEAEPSIAYQIQIVG